MFVSLQFQSFLSFSFLFVTGDGTIRIKRKERKKRGGGGCSQGVDVYLSN